MSASEVVKQSPPEAEAAKIDRKIEETARRISIGRPQPNDFSNMNDLVRQRADLLIPSILRKPGRTG